MKYIFYLLAIILLFGINVGVFPHFRIFGAGPNILLLFVVLTALQKESDLYFVAFFSGLFLDFSTGVFFGSFTLAFLLLALFGDLLLERILVIELNWKYVVGSVVGSMVFTYVVVWAYNALAFKLGFAAFGLDFEILTRLFLPELFYNLLLLYPMYGVVNWFHRFLVSQDRKRVHHS